MTARGACFFVSLVTLGYREFAIQKTMEPNRRQCLVILGTLISFSLRLQECVSFTVLSKDFWSMPMRDAIVTTMN